MAREIDIRIGTLVSGNGADPANYIKQIIPHGFESFSITFWQTTGGVDLKKLASGVNEAIAGRDVKISSLAVFGNPLGDDDVAKEALASWERVIDHAHLFDAPVIAGFTGRVEGKSIPDNIPRYKEIFTALGKRAADNGLKIAFENCSMGGNWNHGAWNIAHNPDAWQLMFDALPAENIGLEWEPCHQLVAGIDAIPQLREWTPRIFHVHGKDATIRWDVVHKHGFEGKVPWAFHRTPGFGDTNWVDVISELRRFGFTGAIDIEGWHDPVYRGDLEMTGQVYGLNYLKACRGDFVANPV